VPLSFKPSAWEAESKVVKASVQRTATGFEWGNILQGGQGGCHFGHGFVALKSAASLPIRKRNH